MTPKQGDILVRKDAGLKVKVLGVCGEVYFFSQDDYLDEANPFYYTLEQLKEHFIFPEEKWVPEYMQAYWTVDATTEAGVLEYLWRGDGVDVVFLSRKLVFKTRPEALATFDKMMKAL